MQKRKRERRCVPAKISLLFSVRNVHAFLSVVARVFALGRARKVLCKETCFLLSSKYVHQTNKENILVLRSNDEVR